MANNVKKIGVAGAGAMGQGIAQVFAQAGFEVVMFDVKEDALNLAKSSISGNLSVAVSKSKITQAEMDAALSRIVFTSSTGSLIADFIIEAIVEKLEPKRELFLTLAEINSPQTIFATNTSSIPVTRIAKGIPNPSRVVGMHFFNPAHIMKLVEVISGAETSDEVLNTVTEISKLIGKTTIACKDSPGFIVNRVARHYYVESLKILEERVSSVNQIDELMKSAGFKLGPFKLMDMVGNDINFAVTSSLHESFHGDAKFRPSRIQQQKVDAGHLGKKSGKGFYNYE
jgi:3-hydroxybutyryl-CoA dehydrogenase